MPQVLLGVDRYYLRKTKKTARTRQRKAAMWFHWRDWVRNMKRAITVKTVREITS